MDVRLEFMDPKQLSTLAKVWDMPECYQQLFQKKILKKVSKLKLFRTSCLALIQDKGGIEELQALIEETLEESQPKRRVNQVKKKFKTRCELRMTV